MKSNFFFRASTGNQPTRVRSGILIPEPPCYKYSHHPLSSSILQSCSTKKWGYNWDLEYYGCHFGLTMLRLHLLTAYSSTGKMSPQNLWTHHFESRIQLCQVQILFLLHLCSSGSGFGALPNIYIPLLTFQNAQSPFLLILLCVYLEFLGVLSRMIPVCSITVCA